MRRRRVRKKGKPPVEILLEDVELWSKTTGREIFKDALAEFKGFGCPCRFLWHSKGIIEVTPKEEVKAVRKRKRRNV